MVTIESDIRLRDNSAAFNLSLTNVPREVFVGMIDGCIRKGDFSRRDEESTVGFAARLMGVVCAAAHQLQETLSELKL